jgi:hypothetical protein
LHFYGCELYFPFVEGPSCNLCANVVVMKHSPGASRPVFPFKKKNIMARCIRVPKPVCILEGVRCASATQVLATKGL